MRYRVLEGQGVVLDALKTKLFIIGRCHPLIKLCSPEDSESDATPRNLCRLGHKLTEV